MGAERTRIQRIRRLLAVISVLGTLVAVAPAGAQARPPAVEVIEVNGLIDAVEVDFIERSLAAAQRAGSQLLVIQLDSRGAVVSDAKVDELAFRVGHAGVPVGVWVGPTGARAYRGAARLVRAAPVAGMAPGTRAGLLGAECRFCSPGEPLAGSRPLGYRDAERRGVARAAETLGDFIVDLDGVEVAGRTLRTARVVTREGGPRREPIAEVRFSKLGLVDRMLHATVSPRIAYLLLVVGLALLVFELFSVGIGLAGLTGAASLVLAAYGLAALPTSVVGLALVAVGTVGFAIDVQAGAPRTWTAIGTLAFALGSWRLFGGWLRLPWLLIVLGVVAMVLFMVAGMPSMLRARFSTPTVGRDALIGERAEALTPIDPEGMVRLREAQWRARTNRSTPIGAGDPVRVVAIEGVTLEVEPDATTGTTSAPGD